MDKGTEKVVGDIILYGGLAVAGYFLLEPIVDDISNILKPNPNAAINDAEAGQQGTPWDPKFYNEQNHQITILTSASATLFANEIYNSMSDFGDNDSAILSIFRQLQTKGQVSFLADTFSKLYTGDLYTWLKNGNGVFPWNGLSTNNLAAINTLVNALPNT